MLSLLGIAMDQAVHRVAVSGPVLGHILQDVMASRGDCDGVLFGHLHKTVSRKLEDDDDLSGMQEEYTAIITGFYCSGSLFSFYDARGLIDPNKLSRLIGDRESRGGDPLIGWFLGRRNTPMRPSLRETAVTRCLCLAHNQEGSVSPATHQYTMVEKTTLLKRGGSTRHMMESPSHMMGSPRLMQLMPGNQLYTVSLSGGKESPIDLDDSTSTSEIGAGIKAKSFNDGHGPSGMEPPLLDTSSTSSTYVGVPPSSPCLFMLLTESGMGQPVHTHEYRLYQYHFISQKFEPRTIKIVNIGPDFRVQYDSFSPIAAFPLLLSTTEDGNESNSSSTDLKAKRRELHQGSRRTRVALQKEQALLDVYSEGYKVERLTSLVDQDGMRQVPELEDLYSKMLLKLESLAKQVCDSSAALSQQEEANKQLRLNATSLD